ncbi:MAG: ABC transporter substrate-binding protein [Thermotogota bacterium]
MRLRRALGLLAVTLVVVLAVTLSVSASGVLRVRLAADVVNLDSAQLHTAADRLVVQQVMEGLVQLDWTQAPPYPVKPRLAKSYEISKDGKSITFQIHEGIQFHGGYGELTADDVVYSLKRHMDKSVGSMEASNFLNVADVQATGPYTVVVTLKTPSALSFLPLLAWQGSGMIVSRRAVEQLGSEYQRHPIGTGPYQFVEWKTGVAVILKKFDGYWGAPEWGFGAPAYDEIECLIIPEDTLALDALETGELDVVGLVEKGSITRAEDIPGVALSSSLGGSWQHILFFNHTKAPMNNLKVRQALAYALDLPTIAKRLGAMQKMYPSPFNEVCFASTDEFWNYSYDPAKAKQLLAEAGYPNGLEISFIYPKVYMYEDVALEVAQCWSQIGVKVNFSVIEYGVYQKTVVARQQDVCIWSMTRFAPYLYAQSYITGSPQNYFGYSNPEMDDLIARASAEPDEQKAKELWREVQKAVSDQAIGIYPAEQIAWVAVSNKVAGVTVIPFSGVFDLAGAHPAQP